MTTRKLDHGIPGCYYFVAARGEQPAKMTAMLSLAEQQALGRIAGGCSGLDDDKREALLAAVCNAFSGYKGAIMSGATLSRDGKAMVTNLPAMIAENNECLAIGTFPRVADQFFKDADGALQVNNDGDGIDTRQHGVTCVQANASQVLEWDGDLSTYFDLMLNLREAGWTVFMIAANGGGVTVKEITGALERDIPLIALRGSGRKTDEFVLEVEAGKWDGKKHLISIVPFDDPNAIRKALLDIGVIE